MPRGKIVAHIHQRPARTAAASGVAEHRFLAGAANGITGRDGGRRVLRG